ncbi:MAG: C_GCAxxG_C_C family protein [Anaerolineae bacterium]|nr:C_GCAxxG_C_C family protein [Anaerolineae bacterium]
MKTIDRRNAQEIAARYFASGNHCSEAVVRALLEMLEGSANPICLRIANPFMGGMAGSKSSACGALTGSLIVAGYLFGRGDPHVDESTCVEVSLALMDRFQSMAGHNSIICQDLYDHRPDGSCQRYVTGAVSLALELFSAHLAGVNSI